MIPRTKVTYGVRDLARATVRRGRDERAREALASELRRRFDAENVLLAPSGRASLAALLEADERPNVVVPAYTCKAVVEASLIAGKTIRYVDAEADGFNMDVDRLVAVVDASCIVVATHQFGFPTDVERIVRIAHAKGALVIEDAAASLGTTIATAHGPRLTGTFADAAFFSFDSTKLVNVPLKGGFLLARDPAWFARVRDVAARAWRPLPIGTRVRWTASGAAYLALENHLAYRAFHEAMFERRGTFTNDSPKVNLERTEFYRYALADWQAAIALPQVQDLDAIVARRRDLYARLWRGLEGARTFALPPFDANREWATIRFPIRVKGDKIAFYRRAVRRGLDFAFSFTFLGCGREFVNAWKLADAVLDVPYYHKLTDAELQRTIDVLRALDEEGQP